MSYALGQSQTPWDVSISEVDLPANQHFNRWGPVSGLGFNFMDPILNTIDPLNLFHHEQQQAAAAAAEDPMKSVVPLVLGGAVVLGVLWYALKK